MDEKERIATLRGVIEDLQAQLGRLEDLEDKWTMGLPQEVWENAQRAARHICDEKPYRPL